MSETENWRAIPEFEGLYEVSDLGRVRSVARTCPKWDGQRSVPERILKASDIYPKVMLSKDGTLYTRRIHNLVLIAFVGPRPNGMFACHNDGNTKNCRINNLRYDTPKANSRDRDTHGNTMRGQDHLRAKLNNSDVIRIRSEITAGKPGAQLARENNVSASLINAIKSRRLWRHI